MGATSAAGTRDRLEAELARLGSMDLAGLKRRWRQVVGRPAPDHLARGLLHRALAYRVQADVLGDLDRETGRMLDRLVGRDRGSIVPPTEVPGTKPGTLLAREWDGSLQHVMVLEAGFAWNGSTYDSLSAVAYAITGTRWNGPRFFGLRPGTGSQDRRTGL